MKDKNEIGFQVTYKKAEKELVLSIIKTTKSKKCIKHKSGFVSSAPAYYIKPIINLSINPEEFLQLVTEFEMKKSAETEKIIQYSTFEEISKNETKQ